MPDTFEIVLAFEIPGPGDEQVYVEYNVRASPGPERNQYRLEQHLFPETLLDTVDEDTIRTLYWECPATYHDLIEADEARETVLDQGTLMFRRLVAPAPGCRYVFRFDHEYLRLGRLSSPEAAALKGRMEQLGAYCEVREGQVRDTLFIYVPPGISYDPTSDVEALRQ